MFYDDRGLCQEPHFAVVGAPGHDAQLSPAIVQVGLVTLVLEEGRGQLRSLGRNQPVHGGAHGYGGTQEAAREQGGQGRGGHTLAQDVPQQLRRGDVIESFIQHLHTRGNNSSNSAGEGKSTNNTLCGGLPSTHAHTQESRSPQQTDCPTFGCGRLCRRAVCGARTGPRTTRNQARGQTTTASGLARHPCSAFPSA